jgi:hypothetical protein
MCRMADLTDNSHGVAAMLRGYSVEVSPTHEKIIASCVGASIPAPNFVDSGPLDLRFLLQTGWHS